MVKRSWFILEIETGLIDGFYANSKEFDQNDILTFWNNARQKYAHIICYSDRHEYTLINRLSLIHAHTGDNDVNLKLNNPVVCHSVRPR